ncbi:MAG TPA: hypothetical protein VGR66_08120 [Candidatus Eisenbacteria bacterium]|nr:hypothetical protein [Candidatus Eisenbacteria bacterium]
MAAREHALISFALAFVLALAPGAQPGGAISAHTAAPHRMRYHLALPSGWSTDRQWPVVVVIADAHRDFAANLRKFVAARGGRPYILVAPEVLTSGGTANRSPASYTYTPAVWDSLQRVDEFAFDDDGVGAVLADVRRKWHGEAKAFLTGWEAGGHTVWALTFRHPERWRGVAPVTPNYQRRGVEYSEKPERSQLPLQVFEAGAPNPQIAPFMKNLEQQIASALADARAHGYMPAPVRVVAGVDHGPLPEAVLAWCDSVRSR